MKNSALLFIALLIGASAYVLLAQDRLERFGAVAGTEMPLWANHFVSVVLLLIGIFLGSAYRSAIALRERKQTQIKSISQFIKDTVRSIDFITGLAGAPIVYGLIVQQTSNISLTGLGMIALQNGFVCPIIIGGLVPSVSTTPNDPNGR